MDRRAVETPRLRSDRARSCRWWLTCWLAMTVSLVGWSSVADTGERLAAPSPLGMPSVLLARTLASEPGRLDVGSNVLPVEGGALVTGWTRADSEATGDGLLLRVNTAGDVVWRRQLGGDGWDLLWSVLPDPAGGYVVAGFTGSSGAGSFDGWLLHVGEDGGVSWEHTYGGAGEDRLTALQPTPDGWIAAGQTDRGGANGIDAWVLRVDREGRELSSWTLGGSETDRAFNLQSTLDGGCVVVGMVGIRPEADLLVARLGAGGELLWKRQPERPGFQVAYDVQRHPDGGYLVVGYGLPPGRPAGSGDLDAYALRLTDEGKTVFESTFGGPTYDRATHARVLEGGEAAVVGYTQRPGAVDEEHGWDLVFYLLDTAGELSTRLRFGGTGFEYGRSIAGEAGDLWLVGHSSSDRSEGDQGSSVFLVRLDVTGTLAD